MKRPRQIQIPEIEGAVRLTPLQLNGMRLCDKQSPLTPRQLEDSANSTTVSK